MRKTSTAVYRAVVILPIRECVCVRLCVHGCALVTRLVWCDIPQQKVHTLTFFFVIACMCVRVNVCYKELIACEREM